MATSFSACNYIYLFNSNFLYHLYMWCSLLHPYKKYKCVYTSNCFLPLPLAKHLLYYATV